jgi:hypothetical protein
MEMLRWLEPCSNLLVVKKLVSNETIKKGISGVCPMNKSLTPRILTDDNFYRYDYTFND